MIQSAPKQDEAAPPRVWGLSARQVHDAFWHARGVQCIRRGQQVSLQHAAEVYMLIEPKELVVFPIARLSDRLAWHDALVTRVRLVDEEAEPYSEQVVLDEDGLVRCIERRYRPTVNDSCRVILTTRPRIANLWMSASDHRDGWTRVRRSVAWPRVDHARMIGKVFCEGPPEQERRLIETVVEFWPQPDQSIDGIEQAESGVWHLSGETIPEHVVRIGPLWLGAGQTADPRRCLVGPEWVGDDASPPPPVKVREIAEVTVAVGAEPGRRGQGGQLYPLVKRVTDLLISCLGLLFLLPVLVCIATLIMLEDGRPIFFGHRRQSRGGRPFRCWKFRTMHRDAEKIARDFEAYNVCDGPQIYIQDDPRVTRVGRLLRAAHLDELPQLWNVVVGQMSLVGPRPSPDDENQFCPAWRDLRLSVRPGITGLWQLNRTREPGEDFREWIKYDIEYVRRANLWLDLSIMAKTVFMLTFGRSQRGDE